MSKVTVTEDYLMDIADAIRDKLSSSSTYTPGQMAAAIESIPTGGITPTGTKSITQNGQTDVTQYATADVNVPNSYAAGDEGKVVQNGALVTQTSETVTQNGTYDTTTKDEVVVDVQGGAPNLQDKTFTQNGVYTADAGYDGFDEVTVNVSGGGGMPLATKVGTLHDGWYFTTGGVLKFDGSDPDSVLDVFSVQAGHKYIFCYGAAAGNRGTIAFTTTNIYANPQDNLALTLIHVIDSSNRKPYYSETIFNVSQNGYIGAYIGNNIGQNISAYLIDITNLS